MASVRRRPSPLHRWIMTTAAAFAAAAQLIIAVLPCVEWGATGTGTHVQADTGGADLPHNEASCASCQALHNFGYLPPPPPLPVEVQRSPTTGSGDARPVASAERTHTNSRAPPV